MRVGGAPRRSSRSSWRLCEQPNAGHALAVIIFAVCVLRALSPTQTGACAARACACADICRVLSHAAARWIRAPQATTCTSCSWTTA